MSQPELFHALEAFLAATALADWKEGGPVKVTAENVATRAEEDFFRLLCQQRVNNANAAEAA